MAVQVRHPIKSIRRDVARSLQPLSCAARCCRTARCDGWRGRTPTRNSHPAFTLLELLLVLAVMAMLSTIALPRVSRLLAKAEHRAAAAGLQAALSQLRLRAIQTGQTHSFRFEPGTGVFEMRAEVDDEVRQIDFDSQIAPAEQPMDESLEPSTQDGSQNIHGVGPRQVGGKLVDWAGSDTLTHAVEGSENPTIDSTNTEGDRLDRRQLEGPLVLVQRLAPMEEETAAAEVADRPAQAGNPMDSQTDSSAGLPLDVSLAEASESHQWSVPIQFYPDGRASDAQFFVVDPSGYAIELTVVGMTGKVHMGQRHRLPTGAQSPSLLPIVQPEPIKG